MVNDKIKNKPPKKVNKLTYMFEEDAKIINELCANSRTNWNKMNSNWHCNLHCSAKKNLHNLMIMSFVLQKLQKKFDYEANIYDHKYYDNLNYKKPEDFKILEDFRKFLLSYNVSSYSWMHKRALKLLQSICDYHALEVIQDIKKSIDRYEEDLMDAPLMWIVQHVRLNLYSEIKDEFLEEIDWRNYVELLMEVSETTVPEFAEEIRDDIELQKSKIASQMIKKAQDKFEFTRIKKDDKKGWIVDITKEKYEKFKCFCDSYKKKITGPGSEVDRADIDCMLYIKNTKGSSYVLIWDSFSFEHWLKNLLDVKPEELNKY